MNEENLEHHKNRLDCSNKLFKQISLSIIKRQLIKRFTFHMSRFHNKFIATIIRKKITFTLLELLIVISIITILAALLLPSLKRAKELGNSINCTSNLKQYGVAFLQYAMDNNERLMYSTASTSQPSPWYSLLKDYLAQKLLKCPSAPVSLGTSNTYGFNHKTYQGRLADLAQQKYWLIIDAKWYFINPPTQSVSDNVEVRHVGSSNLLFCDGHVEARRLIEINNTSPFNSYPLTEIP